MLNKNIYLFVWASMAAVVLLPSVSFAQTVSKPTNPNEPAFASPCTGEIRTDQAAAEACAKKAEEQGKKLGYDISCEAERATFPGGYFFNNTCTIDGIPGFGAPLLAGYDPGATVDPGDQSPAGEGWWVLDGELEYLRNSSPAPSTGTSMGIGTANTTTGTKNVSSSSYVSSVLKVLNNMIANLKSQLNAINSGTIGTSTTNNTTTNAGSTNTANTNTTTTNAGSATSILDKIKLRAQIDGQVSFSGAGCLVFNANLTPGTIVNYNEFDGGTNMTPSSWSPIPSTGSGVLALRTILGNLGYTEVGTGGLTPDEYDVALYRGVRRYQFDNKIPSDTTTIAYYSDTNTMGPIYSTGIFDTVTREFANGKCYKIY